MPRTANPFATARTVSAKPARKDDKAMVDIVGLAMLADIDAVMKSLKAIRDTVEADVKANQKQHFVSEAVKLGQRPVNFRGVEGTASASCELRVRAVNSPLSAAEQELCREHGLPMTTDVSVQETFIINPAYLGDGALLERVGKAIGNVRDIPEDFIQKQAAVETTVVDKTALDVLCASRNETTISSLLGVVGVLAIKLGGEIDMANALETVSGLLGVQTPQSEMKQAA